MKQFMQIRASIDENGDIDINTSSNFENVTAYQCLGLLQGLKQALDIAGVETLKNIEEATKENK